jgi:PAS domain S-box-containing protein
MNDAKQDEVASARDASIEVMPGEPKAFLDMRLAELIRDVGLALIQSTTLDDMAQQCTEALVRHFDAAFARIWTLNGEENVLELRASAGMYTHLNGPHSRVPLGSLKIGWIASERLPHLTNAVVGDPRVSDQAWAIREGMVAFAGYPLLVSERVVGVMALFARYPLSSSTLDAIASVANTIAVGLDRKQGEETRQHLLEAEQQARRRAEAAQERLTRILDNLTDGLMIFDQEWRYRYINPQAAPFTGKPPEELLGKNLWEEFPALVNSPLYQQYSYAVAAREPVAFRMFSSLLQHWFDVRAYPVLDDLVVYFRQITELVRVEEEKRQLLETAQQAHNEAEVALSIRNTFLSSVSHDLKTPLTAIKANMQLVQRRIKREPTKEGVWITERLELMERAITKMTGMIDDLLDLTRLRASYRSEESFVRLDLLPIIRAAVTEQQATTRRHRLLLTTNVEALPVHGNSTRLDRAITNLLSNAIKYSPGGGDVTLIATKEQQGEQAWAQLSCTDQGIGIPASDLPHIFAPFQRASNVTDNIQGTGIGLASVAQVIEQHQGTIAVTSEEGQGSTFTIRIPLAL